MGEIVLVNMDSEAGPAVVGMVITFSIGFTVSLGVPGISLYSHAEETAIIKHDNKTKMKINFPTHPSPCMAYNLSM
ncbi:MAG: hypothetical protein A4E33_00145 [Methanoregula sp. PtaB.Bin085]|nr:MAG: hypothetical protein A4E33_00145 [Methanoregula sp. PtaB.Bin085]